MNAERTMLVIAHTGRPAAVRTAHGVIGRLAAARIAVRVLAEEAAQLAAPGVTAVTAAEQPAAGAEMVIVVGGDGSLLRAAELARPVGVPLFGVNLGHVGFLAEAEPEDLADAVDRVVAGSYLVEERMTVDVAVLAEGRQTAAAWALNEATVEKAARERMVDLMIEIDGRPLSRWGCDGVVFATPTGSTAYAFSAGGPVVWPGVEALLLVPISAHALFAGPMIASPDSVLATEVIGVPGDQREAGRAVLWCDGRRKVNLPAGARIEVRRGARPVLLARLRDPGAEANGAYSSVTFTDRLVHKFGLPVSGWRGQGAAARPLVR